MNSTENNYPPKCLININNRSAWLEHIGLPKPRAECQELMSIWTDIMCVHSFTAKCGWMKKLTKDELYCFVRAVVTRFSLNFISKTKSNANDEICH